jgi:hypothetical protein
MQKLKLSTLKHLLIQRLVSEEFVDIPKDCANVGDAVSLSDLCEILTENYGLNPRDAWEMIARSAVRFWDKAGTPINSIQIPDEFVQLASEWHGGQDSILYAISSTGNLTLGTTMPCDLNTQEEWYVHLWDELDVELNHLCNMLEKKEFQRKDIPKLREFQKYAEETADRLRSEYSLD